MDIPYSHPADQASSEELARSYGNGAPGGGSDADASIPPAGNTGVETIFPVYFHIDWLTFTVWESSIEDFLSELKWRLYSEYLLDPDPLAPVDVYEFRSGFHRFYRAMYEGLLGEQIFFDPLDNSDRFTASLNGGVCNALGTKLLFELVNGLREQSRVQITRLDLAWDFCPFDPAELYQAIQAGNVKGRFQRKSVNRIIGDDGGYTLYIGSRSSQRYLRVYRKKELGMRVRTELEIKDERAQIVFEDLAHHSGQAAYLALGHLCDWVNFDLKGWRDLVDGVEPARRTISEVRSDSLLKKAIWFEKVCGAGLVAFLELNHGDLSAVAKLAVDWQRRQQDKRQSR